MPADVVVMVHPGALPATSYAGLAEALDAELLVIDLERIPAYREMMLCDGGQDVSVARLARYVVDRLVPARSWLMAGWSLGGVVAYAATASLPDHQLPRHLVVLDSIAPVPEHRRDASDFTPEVLLTWFAGYLAAKRGGRLELPAGVLRGRDIGTGLEVVLREAIRVGLVWPDVSVAGLRKVFDVYLAGLFRNVDLTAAYQAEPARVPMTLVRPQAGLLTTPGALGWQRLASTLSVTRCPGDHYSMLRESSVIAGVIRDRLALACSS
ncbi:thioesterase domain-containing protein [Actinocrispum wychmicini]|uniref:Thioesterase domain-containing protein n=1 Tax=Actinocrispum wychmicini TaxID=1213861 RepID=A0A4R2JKQ9_9PSEU|nr:thioesterase domain-containing protein [Actinocrispum wychmicini]TCO60623.1 thioesterase domain-containing protein [Actinocrispum wychmicini]